MVHLGWGFIEAPLCIMLQTGPSIAVFFEQMRHPLFNNLHFHLSCLACAGPGCTVRKCIIDKNSRIGADVQIINKEGVSESNRESDGFVIKDGIVVVIKDSIIPNNTII